MNEKFLSRGKREDTEKWVEGYYVELPEEQNEKKLCLIIGLDGQYNRIIPETVGRCTCLTDKNGKMIFEGDIVIYGDTNNRYYGTYVVAFEQRGGSAYFGIKINDNETWQFCLEVHPKIMEVISNIHDPKLIDDIDKPIVGNIAQPVLKPATEPPENFQISPV